VFSEEMIQGIIRASSRNQMKRHGKTVNLSALYFQKAKQLLEAKFRNNGQSYLLALLFSSGEELLHCSTRC